MTLKDLLEVTDSSTRIRVRVKMYNFTFETSGYRETFLNNNKSTELLNREIKTIYAGAENAISTLVIALKSTE